MAAFPVPEDDSGNHWATVSLELTVVAAPSTTSTDVQPVAFPPISKGSAPSFDHGYALLIGVDEHPERRLSLPVVGKDINAFANVLMDPTYCAYRPEHVKVIRGLNATRDRVFDGLEWLRSRLQEDQTELATAMIYYSGHGWRDNGTDEKALYLILSDTRSPGIKSTALPIAAFVDSIHEMRTARLVVILDCSHAAAIGTEIAKRSSGGYVVLASSRSAEVSYARKDGTMSIFTYHLLEALTGHVQPQEDESEIFVADVISHVSRHVPRSARAWNGEQHPEFWMSGNNFPIGLLLGGSERHKRQAK